MTPPIAALLASAVLVSNAAAHAGQQGPTYQGNNRCTLNSAWLTENSSSAMISSADVLSTHWYGSYGLWPCGPELYKPAGHIRLIRQAWVWTGSAWALCNNSGWKYNESSHFQVWHQRNWPRGSPLPCGNNRYYGTLTEGYVYHNVGGWKGGSVWSGHSHTLP